MLCARTRSRVGVNGSHHDVGTRAVVKSGVMHAPHSRMLFSICCVGYCCGWLESVHAGGVYEICENSEIILSSLLVLTRLDLLGSSCCLMRIAHRSSCVHQRPLLCRIAGRPHTSCCLGTRVPVSSRTTIHSRSHLIGPWIGNDWRQNLWISDCSGWCYITFDSISMQVRSHLRGS